MRDMIVDYNRQYFLSLSTRVGHCCGSSCLPLPAACTGQPPALALCVSVLRVRGSGQGYIKDSYFLCVVNDFTYLFINFILFR